MAAGATAIWVSSMANMPTTNLEISGNKILYYRYGIILWNINYSVDGRGPQVIKNNEINLNIPASVLAGFPHSGIWMRNSRSVNVKYNAIGRDLSFGNYSTGAGHIAGIKNENVLSTLYGNNDIVGVPTGIQVLNNNKGTKFQCNSIDDCYYGFSLGSNTAAASLPDQGNYDPASTKYAGWDNEWNYPSSVTSGRVNDINVAGFKWYFRNGTSGLTNPYYPQTSNTFVQLFGNSNGQTPCPVSAIPLLSREDEIGKIVRGQMSYADHQTENEWYDKQFAFLFLKFNDSLLTIGDANDSLYNAFYDTLLISNIGLFARVADSVQAGSLSDALTINGSITPANTIETNLKEFNRIFINYMLYGTISVDDSSVLASIACHNFFEGGEAVTSSRVLLDWPPDSVCEGEEERWGTNQQVTETGFFYPNPSDGLLTINQSMLKGKDNVNFEVYDATGRKLISLPLANTNSINISSLPKGVYLFKLLENKNILFSSKLLIIK